MFGLIKKHLIILLAISVLMSSLVWVQIKKWNTERLEKTPRHHFYFIAQSPIDPFWETVEKGAKQASEDYNVYLEYLAPRFSSAKEALRYLDIAKISKVDGIITYVPSLEGFREGINEAEEASIPVITVDSDDSSSKRMAYVGANSYVFGKEAANLMVEATRGKAKIAVISSEEITTDTLDYDLKMSGFINGIKDHDEMEVVKTYTSKMGVISAEEITQDIISNHPEVNAIFTLSASDTLGCARLIVDRNKVGSLKLIGTGRSEKILDYIEKGIIHSTVESDGYGMGYKSVEAMVNYLEGRRIPPYIHTEMNIQRRGE